MRNSNSTNDEREQRILDSAAALMLRQGYNKITMADIAGAVGVSRGILYLHFENKDQLFESLLKREMARYAESWLAHLEADPDGGTMAGMYKNMLYALSGSEFMSAIFRRDRHVLGNYLRKPDNLFQTHQAGQSQSPRYEFVRLMQEAGAIRPDLDPGIIAHIMNMLAYGLVAMDEIMPSDAIPPLDDLIEGIARMMDLALTPEGGGNRDIGKVIVRQLVEASRRQVAQAENTRAEEEANA